VKRRGLATLPLKLQGIGACAMVRPNNEQSSRSHADFKIPGSSIEGEAMDG
jgi:hypothetical protein